MKICIVVPSEEQLLQAGVRIRYKRIIGSIYGLGHELVIVPIQNFTESNQFIHDVYIISKCYDARAVLMVHLLANTKKLIGIDLFDDYFSQSIDSRFSRLRHWFYLMLQKVDFVLCSTESMRDVIINVEPDSIIHIMNDPSLPIKVDDIIASLKHKLDVIHKTKTLTISWFGIGDNPYFSVGLNDLVSFGNEIVRLRSKGLDIQLEILTNMRAMTTESRTMLRRLAVPYTIEEWTEQREVSLLKKNPVCFLPVNAQNFSIVKSLNRAVTALCAGVQVFSRGFPLYEQLSPFIYRDPLVLLGDIRKKNLLLQEKTVPNLVQLIEKLADANGEAQSLIKYLGNCSKKISTPETTSIQHPSTAVIHGKEIVGDVHKFAKKMGALSITGPYSKQKVSFDVHFSFNTESVELDVYVLDEVCPMLAQNIQPLLSHPITIFNRKYKQIDLDQVCVKQGNNGVALGLMHTNMSFIASYDLVLSRIVMIVQLLFPGITCLYSDASKLPWWSDIHANPQKSGII